MLSSIPKRVVDGLCMGQGDIWVAQPFDSPRAVQILAATG
jgi:hypothetical protein